MTKKKDIRQKEKPQGRVKVGKLHESAKELDEDEAKRVKGGLVGTFTNPQPNKPKPAIGTFT